MFLHPDDIDLCDSTRNYVRGLMERSVPNTSGFLRFANPHFLAGPFAGHYGLVTLRDTRHHHPPLKTYTQAYNDSLTHAANNMFSILSQAKKAGYVDVRTYLMGRHDPDTKESVPHNTRNGVHFMTEDTLPDSPTKANPHVQTVQCSTMSANCYEFARVLEHIHAKHGSIALQKALDTYFQDYERRKQDIIEEMEARPTLENPYTLDLMGNDDTSWRKCFSDLDSATAFLEDLKDNASPGFVSRTMIPFN